MSVKLQNNSLMRHEDVCIFHGKQKYYRPKLNQQKVSICYNQIDKKQEEIDRVFDLLFEATIKLK